MKFSTMNAVNSHRNKNVVILAESYKNGWQVALRNMEIIFDEKPVKYNNISKFMIVSHLNNKNDSRNMV